MTKFTATDLKVLMSINTLQAVARDRLGSTAANDEAIRYLARLEMLLLDPGTTEAIEENLDRSLPWTY